MAKQKKWSLRNIRKQANESKGVFLVYVLLRIIVVAAMTISCIRGNYENLFYCGLALVLFLLPAVFEKNFGIDIPGVLEGIILFFIFASVVLGEMGNYYTRFPLWDTILHTLNGFLCAAVGFGLVDILHRTNRENFKLSPFFLALVAFCFSMTIGVLWEFFECGMDVFFGKDMQKDMVISSVISTYLSENTKEPMVLENIKQLAVNGKDLGIEGYLDIGLYDTMKDLLVNFAGAIVFSVIGFFYEKNRETSRFAKLFIPTLRSFEEEKENEERKTEKQ